MIRDVNNIEDDIIRKKRIISEMLYTDADLIEVLDNPALDPTCPDEYLYVNIFPFIRVPETQDESKSFVVFMLDDVDLSRSNKSVKTQYLKIMIFVHKDLVKTKYGAERHDLLAAIIRDIFHLSNKMGPQFICISDREGVTDTDYLTRTLQFEMKTPNGIEPFNTNKYERRSIVNNSDKYVVHETIGNE